MAIHHFYMYKRFLSLYDNHKYILMAAQTVSAHTICMMNLTAKKLPEIPGKHQQLSSFYATPKPWKMKEIIPSLRPKIEGCGWQNGSGYVQKSQNQHLEDHPT